MPNGTSSRGRQQAPDTRRLELHARLAALTEVHDAYHFDGYTTEEQFDLYLHGKITEVRGQLGMRAALATSSPETDHG